MIRKEKTLSPDRDDLVFGSVPPRPNAAAAVNRGLENKLGVDDIICFIIIVAVMEKDAGIVNAAFDLLPAENILAARHIPFPPFSGASDTGQQKERRVGIPRQRTQHGAAFRVVEYRVSPA